MPKSILSSEISAGNIPGKIKTITNKIDNLQVTNGQYQPVLSPKQTHIHQSNSNSHDSSTDQQRAKPTVRSTADKTAQQKDNR